MNLAGSGDGERRKSGPAASPDRERSRVSAKRLCKAANIGDFGLREGAAGQERKPDAGASAGDKSLARPAARPGSERLDIGRQAWPHADDAEGSPDATRARVIHTPVRVGSAAMPAPFALTDRFSSPFQRLTCLYHSRADHNRTGLPRVAAPSRGFCRACRRPFHPQAKLISPHLCHASQVSCMARTMIRAADLPSPPGRIMAIPLCRPSLHHLPASCARSAIWCWQPVWPAFRFRA